jgi:hypothetical protein
MGNPSYKSDTLWGFAPAAVASRIAITPYELVNFE